jgi:hypothetical protein
MKKWEYKIVWYGNENDDKIQEEMNKLGSEGWELVNFIKYPDFYEDMLGDLRESGKGIKYFYTGQDKAYFKREI